MTPEELEIPSIDTSLPLIKALQFVIAAHTIYQSKIDSYVDKLRKRNSLTDEEVKKFDLHNLHLRKSNYLQTTYKLQLKQLLEIINQESEDLNPSIYAYEIKKDKRYN